LITLFTLRRPEPAHAGSGYLGYFLPVRTVDGPYPGKNLFKIKLLSRPSWFFVESIRIMRAARILGAESGLTWGEIESSMGTAVLVCPGLAPQGVFSPHTFV